MHWDDDRIKRLTQDWADGYSSAQIAHRLGNVTRNAVIGKVSRLKLPRRIEGSATTSRTWVQPAKRWVMHIRLTQSQIGKQAWLKPRTRRNHDVERTTDRVTHPNARTVPAFPLEPIPIPVDEVYIAPEDRKGLLQLTESSCKWPIGDPREDDFHFCGGPRVPGMPYCEGHCKRAYQSPQEIAARMARAMRKAA